MSEMPILTYLPKGTSPMARGKDGPVRVAAFAKFDYLGEEFAVCSKVGDWSSLVGMHIESGLAVDLFVAGSVEVIAKSTIERIDKGGADSLKQAIARVGVDRDVYKVIPPDPDNPWTDYKSLPEMSLSEIEEYFSDQEYVLKLVEDNGTINVYKPTDREYEEWKEPTMLVASFPPSEYQKSELCFYLTSSQSVSVLQIALKNIEKGEGVDVRFTTFMAWGALSSMFNENTIRQLVGIDWRNEA